jgi:hypothetical protein
MSVLVIGGMEMGLIGAEVLRILLAYIPHPSGYLRAIFDHTSH